jgi:hypothetical protein
MRTRPHAFLVVIALLLLAGCGGTPAPAAPAIREFSLPMPKSGSEWITAGPDGNLWFTSSEVCHRGTEERHPPVLQPGHG